MGMKIKRDEVKSGMKSYPWCFHAVMNFWRWSQTVYCDPWSCGRAPYLTPTYHPWGQITLGCTYLHNWWSMTQWWQRLPGKAGRHSGEQGLCMSACAEWSQSHRTRCKGWSPCIHCTHRWWLVASLKEYFIFWEVAYLALFLYVLSSIGKHVKKKHFMQYSSLDFGMGCQSVLKWFWEIIRQEYC